ncbi:MAG: hypothetical protein LUE64_00940, partial [Candidatus Gastranaerophilales bacterium]|nr:hypothetical protein [Candidatus Gastranaerophilales bacterium]
AALTFYFLPKITLSYEKRTYARMQTNGAMMTSKILAEFSNNNNKKLPSEISKILTEEMNKLVKNPINRKNPAYSINDECLGCVTLIPDDKVKSVVLTGKDKEDKLVLRTVIQPPSFVTYNKDLNENE